MDNQNHVLEGKKNLKTLSQPSAETSFKKLKNERRKSTQRSLCRVDKKAIFDKDVDKRIKSVKPIKAFLNF